jgi:hypothetical protein
MFQQNWKTTLSLPLARSAACTPSALVPTDLHTQTAALRPAQLSVGFFVECARLGGKAGTYVADSMASVKFSWTLSSFSALVLIARTSTVPALAVLTSLLGGAQGCIKGAEDEGYRHAHTDTHHNRMPFLQLAGSVCSVTGTKCRLLSNASSPSLLLIQSAVAACTRGPRACIA